jgi:hypothetical protein
MVGLSLIEEAQASGLVLRVGGDGRLIVRGPRSAEGLARKLLDQKAVVLAAIQSGRSGTAAPPPIIFGEHHFSIWVDDADGPWEEFIPGYHYDIRQPSRLRTLLAPADTGPNGHNAKARTPSESRGEANYEQPMECERFQQ